MLDLLQMQPGGMMPFSGLDWGSIWLYMVLPTAVIGVALVVIVLLFVRRGTTRLPVQTAGFIPATSTTSSDQRSFKKSRPSVSLVLEEVFQSLAPTLIDDEKRVMGELARAGGEVLQSDLPMMTDFSKATVSKVIHSLEVRGIVVREKHKWTYWCRINPRLVERVQSGEMVSPGKSGLNEPVLRS